MLIQIAFYVTSALVFISGITVMTLGDWRKFALKFAGVSIATICAALALLPAIRNNSVTLCETSQLTCLQLDLYAVARNIAFIIFNLTVGRDAIHFKRRDRRETPNVIQMRGYSKEKQ